jgi:hypothetical protein
VERMWGKVVGGWIWCKYFVLMYENGKMRHVETIPGMREMEDKGEWWREWILLWYIVRTLVNVTMYNDSMLIKIKLIEWFVQW